MDYHVTYSTKISRDRHEVLQRLSDDHQQGLVMCHRLQSYLDRYHGNQRVVAAIAKAIIGFYERELKPHFALEEDYVFPLIEKTTGTPVLEKLCSHHQTLRAVVEELRNNETSTSSDRIRAFVSLLEEHIRIEEAVFSCCFKERSSRKVNLETLKGELS